MLVFTLRFDLEGNFLYFSNYAYEHGSEYVNGYIDATLKSHHIYVIYRVNGELIFPPTETPFTAKEVHMTYQINSDGRSTEVSMSDVTDEFQFSYEECRFKRSN
jgi:glucose dehydrogenase